ncbi:MAG: choice-of-anchor L domain-containing protein [Chitinophagales bacterium]
MIRYFFLTLFFLIYFADLHAQLVVDNSQTDDEMVQSLAGEGVVVSNIIFECPDGAYGTFNGQNSNVGMNSGLILTSGTIENAIGPNNNGGITGANGTLGDPDLDQIAGVLGTNDACAVYFDVEVASDTLKFNYVFGSEEYLEFVDSFNDVFAFYIEGPGVPFQNIAFIPNTTIPVTINNVNNFDNSEYYVDNGDGLFGPQFTDDTVIQYDGFTTVLEAKKAVTPCETYTLKLVVADDLDGSLDSGVFIEAGSLTTNNVTLSATTALADAGFESAVEGCIEGIINFDVDIASNDTAIVYFNVGGTAENGVDYVEIPDSIILLPGDTTVQIILTPIADGILEGPELVELVITNTGFCTTTTDSVQIMIQDNIVAIGPDPIQVCPNEDIQLLVSGGINCSWSPTDFLDDPNSCTPIANIPTRQSITYTAYTAIGPCLDSVQVQILMGDDFAPNVTTEYNICEGQTAELSATGTGAYFPTWSPADNLSCTNCENPVFSGTTSATYTVTMFDIIGCEEEFTVNITVGGSDFGLVSDTTSLCLGTELQFDLSGAENYIWSPTAGLSCTDCPTPLVSATENTVYSVTVSSGSCEQIVSKTVLIHSVLADAGSDFSECETLDVALGTPRIDDHTYLWQPSIGLNDSSSAEPQLQLSATSIAITQTYTLLVTDAFGCTSSDAVDVLVDVPPVLSISEPDTIVQGGSVQLTLSGVPTGATIAWSPTESLSNGNTETVTARPSYTTIYTAEVTTELACVSSISVDVVVIPPPVILVPSAFSPNDDGINDILSINGRDIDEILSFQVYNRWGNKVYDYKSGDATLGWNGFYNDVEQNIGVYVYFVEYLETGSEQTKLHKGNVTLIR